MTWLIPPYLVLFLSVVMIGLGLKLPLAEIIPYPWSLCGIALMVSGVATAFSVAARFRHSDSQINTFKTPRNLQTDGLFARSRNPIYLGMLVFLVGLAVLLKAASVWIGPLVFFLIANTWYIPVEEKNAAETFGDAYLDYKKRVRRWF